jgi:transposase
VNDRSDLSRGDRNRNDKLAQLRELLPVTNAIVGIDLADNKQAAVVTDHDSRVLARRTLSCRPWELGELLDWVLRRARAAGFRSATVACEPTGHRWRVLDKLSAQRGLPLVCVQPLLVWRAREGEDLTWDKSDPKDAVIIARLAAGLRCYVPERTDATWARLRHLGARRVQLTTDATAGVQQLRDLLECVWPAALSVSGAPFRSRSWCASMAVVLDRAGGDLRRLRRLGRARFTAAVRRELPRWGATRPCLHIVAAVFDALTDPVGVTAHRPGGPERAHLVLEDWQHTRRRLADIEARLVTSIDGLTAVGAATLLAETGDLPGSAAPGRWSSTPGSVRGTTPTAPTRARPPYRVVVARSCGSRPGAPCGPRCRTTPCSPPDSTT